MPDQSAVAPTRHPHARRFRHPLNEMWPDFEEALEANDVNYTHHVYPGTMHGLHNNSTPRFNEEQAGIAEEWMVEFFRKHLS